MKPFRVKLSPWVTPTTIMAETVHHARQIALERFKYCDCGCGELTKIEWIGKIDPKIKREGIYA